MDQLARNMNGNMNGFPFGGFSAIMVTAMLFMALPLLTQIQPVPPDTNSAQSIFIGTYKPPPLPEEHNQPETPKMIERDLPEEIDQPKRVKPKFEIPSPGKGINRHVTGGIEIAMSHKDISIQKRVIPYNPDEVDQPPRYLRTFPAQYPYHAKRDSIEGKVLLRFVVGIDGLVKEAEVAKADPAGFFEEAALKAIKRYKFKPAVKDGKAVVCNAALAITFEMD